ncbi:DUF4809 family protein [Vagococcus vulneris]|uniref:DUF4809 domain-containing protein n=1 Tax=Vagococcus vulneris TaxID=1977869 RepID=A0A429ZYA9_9ENTE|nr:DUF4809 family protein [Vagococcus vulneris]RST98931.1 hypothetical protein CBF37_06060 [Vagococcus vulneris]
MTNYVITKTSELFNGGCNACPSVLTDFYHLDLNGIPQTMDTLSTNDLVRLIAQNQGFKMTQEFDVDADYDVFKKNDTTIRVMEEIDKYIYQSGSTEIVVHNLPKEPSIIFAEAVEILTKLFNVEDIAFELACD